MQVARPVQEPLRRVEIPPTSGSRLADFFPNDCTVRAFPEGAFPSARLKGPDNRRLSTVNQSSRDVHLAIYEYAEHCVFESAPSVSRYDLLDTCQHCECVLRSGDMDVRGVVIKALHRRQTYHHERHVQNSEFERRCVASHEALAQWL